jgi:hypothetical protein
MLHLQAFIPLYKKEIYKIIFQHPEMILHRSKMIPQVNLQSQRSKKRETRNRSKLQKDNLRLKEEIEKLRKKCDKYKIRYQRTEKQYKPNEEPKPD